MRRPEDEVICRHGLMHQANLSHFTETVQLQAEPLGGRERSGSPLTKSRVQRESFGAGRGS